MIRYCTPHRHERKYADGRNQHYLHMMFLGRRRTRTRVRNWLKAFHNKYWNEGRSGEPNE